MEPKEAVRALLDRLPDDGTLEQVVYHSYVLQEIEAGLRELDDGRGIPHEQVAAELRRKWQLGAESPGLPARGTHSTTRSPSFADAMAES